MPALKIKLKIAQQVCGFQISFCVLQPSLFSQYETEKHQVHSFEHMLAILTLHVSETSVGWQY